jgi:hypothetical protein
VYERISGERQVAIRDKILSLYERERAYVIEGGNAWGECGACKQPVLASCILDIELKCG